MCSSSRNFRLRAVLIGGLGSAVLWMSGICRAADGPPAQPPGDFYLAYVRSAPEFQPLPPPLTAQPPRPNPWTTWIYMPWRYQWTIGTGDEGGRFCQRYGINGGFTDHGQGPFDWLTRYHLRFYNDHTAAKGYLYLRGANRRDNFRPYQRDPRAVRRGTDGPQPIDENLARRLEQIVTRNVQNVKQSPMRVAYALDDEISWGAFVIPICWRLNQDDDAYARWLQRYYGPNAPPPRFVSYDDILPELDKPLGQLDLSPLLDRITYNDSLWAVFLRRLVRCANRVDPGTPCGFVGGQAPNMWGGYDYAKLIKQTQFIEAYDLGSAQEIIRSFNPHNLRPVVTTHFHRDQLGSAHDVWQAWYYFAHGNRGMIGWVEGWFEGSRPRAWLDDFRPTLVELGQVQGPKLIHARWLHDGVAIYYSHPSIQVSWCLDAQAHGRTWINRGNDHRLGTSHLVRKAWEYMLNDAGLQYNFIPYDEVIRFGVPPQYRVLILPACYALSDIEAKRIEEFCRRGGTVIADFGAGIFDHHGRGRRRGALDELFGVHHDGTERAEDFFAERLWVETDQDRAYGYQRYAELFSTLDCRLHQGFAVAEKRLPISTVRQITPSPGVSPPGRAVYLNLSPQRYLEYRQEGHATAAQRELFLKHVFESGVKPWLKITSRGKRPAMCEAVYWHNGDRTLVLIVHNGPIRGRMPKNAAETQQWVIPLEVELSRAVEDVVDERTGKHLGDGRRFHFSFHRAEAVFFSFRGLPPQEGLPINQVGRLDKSGALPAGKGPPAKKASGAVGRANGARTDPQATQ